MEHHPYASMFPLMEGAELDALTEDIRQHGLREAIITFEGKILEGRNRDIACEVAGVEPLYREFPGSAGGALAFVWSENFHRRHLTDSQAAAAIVERQEIEDKLRAEAKERQRKGQKKGGKTAGRGRPKNSFGQKVDQKKRDNEARTDAKLAKAAGTNRQYIADARKLKQTHPEKFDEIKQGKKKIPQAKREAQREQQLANLERAADEAAGQPVDWRIIIDDCLVSLPELEDGIANLVFADPPYNIGIDYGLGASADRIIDSEYIAFCRDWLAECVRILSPTGTLWVMIGDEYADHFGVLLRELGLHRRAWVKWYETFGVNCQNNFNRCSRHLFYCVKDEKQFTFNREAVSRESDRQAKYNDKRADPAGKTWDDVWMIPRLVGTAKERIPEFPTQVPLTITRAIVGACSLPGDLVVDPFSGSGSTGVACIELNRRFIGIEKSERFAELSQKRLMVV
jgi:site-specific DNA-methyltransferase (adenine-specific)